MHVFYRDVDDYEVSERQIKEGHNMCKCYLLSLLTAMGSALYGAIYFANIMKYFANSMSVSRAKFDNAIDPTTGAPACDGTVRDYGNYENCPTNDPCQTDCKNFYAKDIARTGPAIGTVFCSGVFLLGAVILFKAIETWLSSNRTPPITTLNTALLPDDHNQEYADSQQETVSALETRDIEVGVVDDSAVPPVSDASGIFSTMKANILLFMSCYCQGQRQERSVEEMMEAGDVRDTDARFSAGLVNT